MMMKLFKKLFEKKPPPAMSQNEWIISDKTGISSKTMWMAINDVKGSYRGDKPYDPADFGRCLNYVQQCGITKPQLKKVYRAFPWFKPFIVNWDKIEELYNSEKDKERMPLTYEYIQELGAESNKIRYGK